MDYTILCIVCYLLGTLMLLFGSTGLHCRFCYSLVVRFLSCGHIYILWLVPFVVMDYVVCRIIVDRKNNSGSVSRVLYRKLSYRVKQLLMYSLFQWRVFFPNLCCVRFTIQSPAGQSSDLSWFPDFSVPWWFRFLSVSRLMGSVFGLRCLSLILSQVLLLPSHASYPPTCASHTQTWVYLELQRIV